MAPTGSSTPTSTICEHKGPSMRFAYRPLTARKRCLLGFAGCLQFFDALFLGKDEAVELTVNSLYPGKKGGPQCSGR